MISFDYMPTMMQYDKFCIICQRLFFAVLAPIFAAMNLTILPNFLFIPVLWLSVQFLNHVLHQARPLVLQLVQDHSEIEIKGIFKRNQIKNILSDELIHAFIKQHWTNNLYTCINLIVWVQWPKYYPNLKFNSQLLAFIQRIQLPIYMQHIKISPVDRYWRIWLGHWHSLA